MWHQVRSLVLLRALSSVKQPPLHNQQLNEASEEHLLFGCYVKNVVRLDRQEVHYGNLIEFFPK